MAKIRGTQGDDPNLRGTRSDDLIDARGGDDTVYARGGADRVYGRAGGDVLQGQFGDDWLYGGPGPDTLGGGRGIDRLWGGAGPDLLEGGPGCDYYRGEGGADTFRLRGDLSVSDVVYDFRPRHDTLDLSRLVEGGREPLAGELSDYVRVNFKPNGETRVQVDVDGAGGEHGFVTAAFLEDVHVDLTAEQVNLEFLPPVEPGGDPDAGAAVMVLIPGSELGDGGELHRYDLDAGTYARVAEGLSVRAGGEGIGGAYFCFADSGDGVEPHIWTPEGGLVQLADLMPGEVGSAPPDWAGGAHFTACDNGLVVFSAGDPDFTGDVDIETNVYAWNGTELAELVPGDTSGREDYGGILDATEIVASGDHVFASAYRAGGEHGGGFELVHHNLATGKTEVIDIEPGPGSTLGGPGSSHPANLVALGGDVLFSASTSNEDGNRTTKLFRYDPESGDLSHVGDSYLFDPIAHEGYIYGVTAPEGAFEQGLARIDPSDGDVDPLAPELSLVTDPLVYDGDLYFGAHTEDTGLELYRFDTGRGEALLVDDIVAGGDGSNPRHLTVAPDGKLYFAADDGDDTNIYAYDAAKPNAGATVVASDVGGVADLDVLVPQGEGMVA